jgi:hypothetical protein
MTKMILASAVMLVAAGSALVASPALAKGKKVAVAVMSVEEKLAESVWKLRAALNVAALQCQFDPALKTIDNYNQVNKLHKAEIDSSRATLESFYHRQFGRGGLNAFDKYNTKLWNSFSTVNYQRPFCQKTSEVGLEAVALPVGGLTVVANNRVPEILAIFPAPVKAAPVAKSASKKKRRTKKK